MSFFLRSSKKASLAFFLLLNLGLLQACGTVKQYKVLPAQLENRAQVPGFDNIRSWGDAPNVGLEKSAIRSLQEEKAANHGRLKPEMTALALSGGGADGAFGAGYICGWTKSGKRPQFKLVTGISTGALMAPFVFLGPAYDAKLKKLYTNISDKSIYKPYSIVGIFMSIIGVSPSPSLADNSPLEKLVAKEVDAKMLRRIAEEHRKGRRLIIGTTQFNAQRLVIWNMGAIASSHSPEALKLFHQIMVASSSLPVSFPPQMIKVRADGQIYQEMHVDGGIEVQVMLYENALTPFAKSEKRGGSVIRPRTLYIIRNQKIYPEWQYVKPELKDIALRSIDSLTKSQGIGDTFRLYTYAQRDHINFNLTFIPSSFKEIAKTPFDNAYMRKAFDLGYRMGSQGSQWQQYPPDYEPV